MTDSSRPGLGKPRRVGGDGEIEVFCADEQTVVPVDLDRWQQLATHVLVAEGVRGFAELSLLFIGEADMAELNEQHMGKQGPTDVLAFPSTPAITKWSRRRTAAAPGPIVLRSISATCRCSSAMSWCALRSPNGNAANTPEHSTTNSHCSWCMACCTCSATITMNPRTRP